jgi:hypothetical protein
VTINNITVTVGGTPHTFPVLSATFAEALVAGKHYTLVVDLKKVTFAGSNIFWDGERLTFLDNGAGGGYQGVFFRWGALVGLSPYGDESGNSEVWNNAIAYTPNVNDGTWTAGVVKNSAMTYGWTVATGTSTDLSENYLYDNPNFSGGQGDICAYLTGKTGVPAGNWRMPNAAEFGVATDYSTSTWSSVSISGSAADQVAGKGTPNRGQHYYASSVASLFFPAGGYRTATTAVSRLNNYGYNWTGTPGSTTDYAYYMGVLSGGATVGENGRNNFFPVRCVKI